MIRQYVFVLKNDMFFCEVLVKIALFGFEALACVVGKLKCAICEMDFKLVENILVVDF